VWSKEFMEAGKKRLAGDTERQASSGEVKDLRLEMGALKELVRISRLRTACSKKHLRGWGRPRMRLPRRGEARDHPAGRGVAKEARH